MDNKLVKITELTNRSEIVIPPGPYENYDKSGSTYISDSDGVNEILADNPYIFEYLLYKGKKDLIPMISNMYYVGRQSIRSEKKKSEFPIFFYEEIAYLLEFDIYEKELPVFKIFLDLMAYKRKGSRFFPWNLKQFISYSEGLTHSMKDNEVVHLHNRLCEFQQKKFPSEALENLFKK